jgi:23S rRNA pseudouridine1911/1915/1917 synthase
MYLAVTRGTRDVPQQFRVDFPIGSAINSKIRLKLWHNPQEGLDALTHFVRLAQWDDYTLFACLPQTGRTNQIRVHLAAIGHWIIGDKMYHPNEEVFLRFYEEGYTDFVAENVLLPRHWLHNTGIQFLGKPESPLGRAPVIAPLTDDLLVHGPTLELLRAAGFPAEPGSQKEAFSKLFSDLLLLDFSETEIVLPGA